MEAHCIDVEQIGEIVGLPEDHPQRRHALSCPRCRSLLASYREFVKAEPVGGSGVEKARAPLDDHIRAGAERWIASQAPASSQVREPWWRGWLKPAPLLATAAVAAIAAVMLWNARTPQEGALRDGNSGAQPFSLQPARVDAESIHLSWTPMPGADRYEVRLFGPDLSEIYRHPETAQTKVVIPRSALPSTLPPSLDLTWRVYALSGGDPLEASAPGSIRAP
ncbi:MAG TPA: hypothetical protein VFU38_08190 [Candidatus Krumholzibacteria bacterium]|nr:hypothetical protein [Candidatus Krumholzibacteria bacterium]